MNPRNFLSYNSSMDCNHNWLVKEVPTPNGGYMRLRFCHNCKETEGYGFVSREHEIQYLNTLLQDDPPEDL